MDTPGASSYTGISEFTLRCWRSRGQGPAYSKLGARVYYSRADLDQYMRERRVEPEPVRRAAVTETGTASPR